MEKPNFESSMEKEAMQENDDPRKTREEKIRKIKEETQRRKFEENRNKGEAKSAQTSNEEEFAEGKPSEVPTPEDLGFEEREPEEIVIKGERKTINMEEDRRALVERTINRINESLGNLEVARLESSIQAAKDRYMKEGDKDKKEALRLAVAGVSAIKSLRENGISKKTINYGRTNDLKDANVIFKDTDRKMVGVEIDFSDIGIDPVELDQIRDVLVNVIGLRETLTEKSPRSTLEQKLIDAQRKGIDNLKIN